MTTTQTQGRAFSTGADGCRSGQLSRLFATLLSPMSVRIFRSRVQEFVGDPGRGSVEVEAVPVQEAPSLAGPATPSSPLVCTWVSTRSGGGGLEMRWVSRPDARLDRGQEQAARTQAATPALFVRDGDLGPSRTAVASRWAAHGRPTHSAPSGPGVVSKDGFEPSIPMNL